MSSYSVEVNEPEPIYNYSWYPGMQSSVPNTCCFATVCKQVPIHLWDAYESRKLRATYKLATKDLEPTSAFSVELTMDRVYAGLDGWLYAYDIASPGLPLSRTRLKNASIVSCMDVSARHQLIALGTYSGHVVLVPERQGGEEDSWDVFVFAGGVSQVKFSPTSDYLVYVSGRRAHEIVCVDVRRASSTGSNVVVKRFPRVSANNQRLEFDVWGECIAFGTVSSKLQVWNVAQEPKLVAEAAAQVSGVVINGVSFNAAANSSCLGELAIATGTRQRPVLASDSDDEEEEEERPPPSEVQIWRLN